MRRSHAIVADLRSQEGCQAMFTSGVLGQLIDSVDCCPPGARSSGAMPASLRSAQRARGRGLYTPEERRRRDASPWTLVQGVLAPAAVLRLRDQPRLGAALPGHRDRPHRRHRLHRGQDAGALHHHGHGLGVGAAGVRALSVRAGVLLGRRGQHPGAGAAHLVSRVALFTGALDTAAARCCWRWRPTPTYLVNATQFVLKLRAARLEQARWDGPAHGLGLSQ